ncbi:MAG: NAD(P)H-hydrate dehydratase [Acutalibacteraceae bacterium]
MKILSAQQMRILEQRAVENGATYFFLMKTAGKSAAQIMTEKMNVKKGDKVVALCGKGNNGGDGFIASAYLKEHGIDAEILLIEDEPKTPDAKAALANASLQKVPVWRMWEDKERIINKIKSADYVIDALYGIGFKGELRDEIKLLADLTQSLDKRVLSIDIPSGVECDTGKVLNGAFCAEVTVSFTTLKPAHILYPSMDYCGNTVVADVGIKQSLIVSCEYMYKTIEHSEVFSSLPKLKISDNKGSRGTLLTVCGSYGMAGAAKMSIQAALRSGAGLVKAAVPESVYPILSSTLSEPVFLPVKQSQNGSFSPQNAEYIINQAKSATALLIGCGLSFSDDITDFVCSVLSKITIPVIIDADGINAVSKHIDILKQMNSTAILTPHPGEMARLFSVSVSEIQNNRIEYAKRLATQYNCVAVLKGAKTVVADISGEIFINTTGNPGMARGGSGDVLAGIIASLTAQGISPFNAAKAGVYIHGLAGDVVKRLKGELSMLPTDITEILPQVFMSK